MFPVFYRRRIKMKSVISVIGLIIDGKSSRTDIQVCNLARKNKTLPRYGEHQNLSRSSALLPWQKHHVNDCSGFESCGRGCLSLLLQGGSRSHLEPNALPGEVVGHAERVPAGIRLQNLAASFC